MLSYYYYCHIFHVSIHLKIEVQSLEYQCSCMYSTYMYEKMAVVYITYCSVQYILSYIPCVNAPENKSSVIRLSMYSYN